MQTCHIRTGWSMQQETLRDSTVPCGLVGTGNDASAYAQVEYRVVKDVVQSSIWWPDVDWRAFPVSAMRRTPDRASQRHAFWRRPPLLPPTAGPADTSAIHRSESPAGGTDLQGACRDANRFIVCPCAA